MTLLLVKRSFLFFFSNNLHLVLNNGLTLLHAELHTHMARHCILTIFGQCNRDCRNHSKCQYSLQPDGENWELHYSCCTEAVVADSGFVVVDSKAVAAAVAVVGMAAVRADCNIVVQVQGHIVGVVVEDDIVAVAGNYSNWICLPQLVDYISDLYNRHLDLRDIDHHQFHLDPAGRDCYL